MATTSMATGAADADADAGAGAGAAITDQAFNIPAALWQIQIHVPASSSSSPPADVHPALPAPPVIALAASSLHSALSDLPAGGLGPTAALAHVLHDLVPGFNGSKTSSHYYGFVTGGVLPVAEAAERIVAAWDQNVQVHLPHQSVATSVEWRAGALLCDLLHLESETWLGRTFTTGATASNVLGLACGREAVLGRKVRQARLRGGKGQGDRVEDAEPLTNAQIEDERSGGESDSVGELGILAACRLAGVEEFQVLTTMGHSSLSKAASIVGLGRKSVIDVGLAATPWKFDLEKLELLLARPGTANIVAVSCGEVNTGRYATGGLEEMKGLREMCDRFGAWLHVDGAFGLFARALPPIDEFAGLREACKGIELADSITGDAHKCLNVPYDCGFFLTPSIPLLTRVFRNPNAAYLSSTTPSATTAAAADFTIPSPLNIGIENSRRFRALPVYAVLVAHGRAGLADMFARQVRLARRVAAFVSAHSAYELLPTATTTATAASSTAHAETGIIVLFRAVDPTVNVDLAARINRSGKIMVSGTAWAGGPAVRIAVSTWMVEVERDLKAVTEVLEEAIH